MTKAMPPVSELDELATFVTGRLVLSPLQPGDAEEMVVVLNDERLHEFTGGQPLSLEELRLRYQRLAIGRSPDGEQTWLNWIVRLRATTVAVGTVQATVSGAGGAQHAQIAWVVGIPWQGQGIASEATNALVSRLDQRGVLTISANIHPQHVASRKVASRAGLQVTKEIVDAEQVWRRPEKRRAC